MPETPSKRGLSLLGTSETPLPTSPDEATIEVFENHSSHRDYTITLDCPEFSSLCPVTGQPDTARIQIEYIPDLSCLETKSIKLFLASFRNFPSFNEEVVNRLLDDLVAACQPRKMTVRGAFSSRGGIKLTAEASHSSSD